MEFITAEEKKMLEERLAVLKANRPVLSLRIAEARANGDLKENADYHAAREDQAMQEADVRRLEDRLSRASVVESGSMMEGVVFVGATVKLREVDSGDEELYKLVGEAGGTVSIDIMEVTVNSPMGESLMKARIGEIIKVDAPRKTIRFEVVEIL